MTDETTPETTETPDQLNQEATFSPSEDGDESSENSETTNTSPDVDDWSADTEDTALLEATSPES